MCIRDRELGLSEEDSRLLTGSKVLSDLCDHCIQAGIAPQTAANLSLIHIWWTPVLGTLPPA